MITSPHNPRIRQIIDLHNSKGRKSSGLFLMEGPHLLLALFDASILPQEVYYQPDLLRRTPVGVALLKRLSRTQTSLIEVSERVIAALDETQSSQGVVSILPVNEFAPARLKARRTTSQRPALLILDRISDPGNLGTILRTALAADVDEVCITVGSVDCYSPKVVRAAAGAHIALPISTNLSWPTIAERIAQHCDNAPRVLLAEAGSAAPYYRQNLQTPFALIIGNEAQGPSAQARTLATHTISIPLANGVESLNAAMATGIILYEAVRQKNTQDEGRGDACPRPGL
jgi:TrmH family RNA methyltransferase